MIKNNTSLSIAEIQEYIKKDKDNEELMKFTKNFTKLTPKNAQELRKKLNDLDLMKLKQEQLTKIIEIMPEEKEELNKIFSASSISLSEDESNKILDTVKEFK